MKYGIGDKVKIKSELYGHGFKIGQEVVIKEIDGDDNNCPYRVIDTIDSDWWWIGEDEIEDMQYGSGSEGGNEKDVQRQILDAIKEQNELLKKMLDKLPEQPRYDKYNGLNNI